MAKWLVATMICFYTAIIPGPAPAGAPGMTEGDAWPRFSLPVPKDAITRHYLGLKGSQTFSVEDIQAEFVLVQIFSMYCPICQREAPRINQLFNAINQREGLSRRLKMMGIGAGNSGYEVQFYRQNYQVSFPLFADGDYKLHKLLGEVGTPHFFLLKIQADGRTALVYQKSGGFKDPEAFLKEILKRSRLD